jgi:hypothetical protein
VQKKLKIRIFTLDAGFTLIVVSRVAIDKMGYPDSVIDMLMAFCDAQKDDCQYDLCRNGYGSGFDRFRPSTAVRVLRPTGSNAAFGAIRDAGSMRFERQVTGATCRSSG